MKLQNLRFFVAVVEHGGITEAANRLRVSQPAISIALKALEEELGGRLFERKGTKRRAVPSPQGVRFYTQAKIILNTCETAKSEFRMPHARPETMRIGVLRTVPEARIAMLLDVLGGALPGIRIGLREGSEGVLSDWLRQGRIEMSCTLLQGRQVHAAALWTEPYVALCGRNHRLGYEYSRPTIVKDLDGEGYVLRGTCELKSGSLKSSGLNIKPVARVERDSLALELVSRGAGIAIAPRCLKTDKVLAIEIEDLGLERTIGLKWRSDLRKDYAGVISRVATAIDWNAVDGFGIGNST